MSVFPGAGKPQKKWRGIAEIRNLKCNKMELQLWNKKCGNVFLLILCLLLTCCKNNNTSNDLIVFDVTASFPVKTLDIAEVADLEYVVLDISDDDYLFRFFYAMTDSFIICERNNEVLFFSRSTGKPVSKLNRYGQGPGEYVNSLSPVYSEIKDELFIRDGNEIKVYGRDGTFKRKFTLMEDLRSFPFYTYRLFDYDEEHLLLYGFPARLFVAQSDDSMKDTSFMLVSKQDGLKEVIPIPFESRISIVFQQGLAGTFAEVSPAIRNGNDFLLTDYSSDTVYRFTPDRQLIPVLVREPSIQKMQTKIFLHSWLETGRYLFFSTQKIDLDWNTQKWPPEKGYLMEKNSGKFFQTHIQMRDFKGYELILGPSVIHNLPNEHTGIIVWNTLELHTANSEGKLSGKLKEVTDRLTEDDERVFMILTFK